MFVREELDNSNISDGDDDADDRSVSSAGGSDDSHQQASHFVKSIANDFWNRKLKSENPSEEVLAAGSRCLVKRNKETSDQESFKSLAKENVVSWGQE